MRLPGSEAQRVVAATGALLVAIMAGAAYVLAAAHDEARAPLVALEARYARLAGLGAVGAQIEASLAEVTETLARHAHPAASGADRIGTDLQQRARRVAEEAGMSVTGSQILPVRAAGGFAQIPVAVTVEGGLEALRAMLLGLGEERPSVQLDSIVIHSRARRRGEGPPEDEPLTAQMNLSVLQLQP